MRSLSIFIGSMFAAVCLICRMPFIETETRLLDLCNGEGVLEFTDGSSSVANNDIERISASPMRNYYYNLRDNFGYNEIGSCGYVALGMLLTYYDSYYNDAIVREQYDADASMANIGEYNSVSSPGSNECTIETSLFESYIATLINDYSSTSLHANLVKIGDELGYTRTGCQYSLGTTPDILENVLNEYLLSNNLIDEEKWFVNKYSNDNYNSMVPGKNYTYSDMMTESVKEYLKLDIPVLLSIRGSSGGHVVIAYDYDEIEDIIYANFGWHSYGHHENVFSYGYNYIRGYITLSPYDLHTHCDNYIVDGENICSCALPNHTHEFTCKSISSTMHQKTCFCGYSVNERHVFSNRGTGRYVKYLICGSCGYMKPDDGGFYPIIQTSVNQMIAEEVIRYEN